MLQRNWTNNFCGFTAEKSPLCGCKQKVCPEMLFVLDTRLFPALALIRELGRRAESCAGFVGGKHNWKLQCQCLCERSLLRQKLTPELCPQTALSSSSPKFSCFTLQYLCQTLFPHPSFSLGRGVLSPGSSLFPNRNYLENSDAAHV